MQTLAIASIFFTYIKIRACCKMCISLFELLKPYVSCLHLHLHRFVVLFPRKQYGSAACHYFFYLEIIYLAGKHNNALLFRGL